MSLLLFQEMLNVSFLLQIYRVDLRQAAWFSAVPWSMMAIVGYFAGAWSDILIQRGLSITMTRKIMQVCPLCKLSVFIWIFNAHFLYIRHIFFCLYGWRKKPWINPIYLLWQTRPWGTWAYVDHTFDMCSLEVMPLMLFQLHQQVLSSLLRYRV